MDPMTGGLLSGLVSTAGAASGAIGSAIADRFSASGKALRAQQKKDIADLQQGKLGLSEAEKRSMLAGTQRGLQAQTAGIEANLRRQAAAAGGFGRSGAQTRAMSQLAGGQQEQMAKAAGGIDALSQQVAQNRFRDIMARLEGRRAEAMQIGAAIGGAAAKGTATGLRDYGRRKNVQADESSLYYLADALDSKKAAEGKE